MWRDDLVIDCAMNAGVTVITSNLRDFQNAKESLRLQIMTPSQAERESVQPEKELTPEIIAQFQQRLQNKAKEKR